VVSSVQVGPGTSLSIAGATLPSDQFEPLGFSASGEVSGKLVLAGYGIQKPELGRKDLDGAALKDTGSGSQEERLVTRLRHVVRRRKNESFVR